MNKFFKKKNQGLTLVEALIIFVVIGIVSVIVFAGFSSFKKGQVLKNTSDDVLSMINKAKSQSMASLDSSEYGVHFETNKVTLFKGTTYISDAIIGGEVLDISSPVTISNISISGGSSDIYFNRLNGAPNKTGTVTISNSSSSKIITISSTGAVSIN